MPSHKINISIKSGIILNKDVTFEVKSDKSKLGDLLVSKGAIEWRPARKSVKKHKLTWEKFAQLMADKGKT